MVEVVLCGQVFFSERRSSIPPDRRNASLASYAHCLYCLGHRFCSSDRTKTFFSKRYRDPKSISIVKPMAHPRLP